MLCRETVKLLNALRVRVGSVRSTLAILVAMLKTSSAASSPFHLVSVPLAFKGTVGAKCFLPFWFPLFTAASGATLAASGAARDPPHVILRDGAHGR